MQEFKCVECGKVFLAKKNNRNLYCSKLCRQRNWTKKNKEHIKKYREDTKEQRNARRREKYKMDKDFRKKVIEKSKEYHLKNPKAKKSQRLKKYGLTLDDYGKMLKKQKYSCAICGYNEFENKNFFPLVDHCHASGKVRGLLCANCNHVLGKMKDNPELLRKAALYLDGKL